MRNLLKVITLYNKWHETKMNAYDILFKYQKRLFIITIICILLSFNKFTIVLSLFLIILNILYLFIIHSRVLFRKTDKRFDKLMCFYE